MAMNGTISASVVPISELLSQTVLAILDTVNAANEVSIQKENFIKFSNYLGRVTFILKELSKLEMDGSEGSRNAFEMLNREIKNAKQLALECSNRNKVYLLINCRKIMKRIEGCTKEISQALSLIPLDKLDVSLHVSNTIRKLCKNMMDAEYCAAIVEEQILEKIESGIQETNVDRSYANDLLDCISLAVGISTELSALKKEFEEFKSDMEDARLRVDMAEARKLKQIIELLEKADATTSHDEKQKIYLDERNSLGRHPLVPLRSFYCPLTQDVMTDPVEISSGRTFERSAIEKWFAEGNKQCPSTLTPLENLDFWPNKTLRQSIQQWKDRNKMTTIVSIKPKLQLNDEQEVLQSLSKLQDLCMERELHREWVTMEEYIPILIGLLGTKNREIRTLCLDILCILARDSDENKERIAKVDHALESIVCSLAHQIGESKSALRLLLQLSRINAVQDVIGNIQGCMFLLVAMLNSDDPEASREAQELLENLSSLDQNVIQMAKANYFKPLIQLLSSGPEDVKVTMAGTLSEIELTDHNKLALFRQGALGPLLQLLSHSDLEMKTVAVRALKNLSNIPQNGLLMIKEGALGPMFELLYRHGLSSPSLRELVAAIIMHLAISTCAQETHHPQKISILESEEDIFKLFSLISLTGPDIQKCILRTFQAMCQSPSGPGIRAKLRQISAVQVLVQLCELNNHSLRANAVKLFCCLTEDGDDSTFLEHVGQRCIETLLGIIKTSSDVEEIAAALGIIYNLPKDMQMTRWLLDAGALQVILKCLTGGNRNASYKRPVVENAVGALCRFTVSTNQEWQKRVAEVGIIPLLVQLLVSGTSLTKQNAAISLRQFSESSSALSQPVKKPGLFFCCLAAPETGCPVHLGICSVESSFCILEANALEPLVKMLGETDLGVCEASLDALLTLIDGERLPSGSKVLAEAKAITPIIKLLSSPSTRLQEKTMKALERVFQLAEIKEKYGKSAQVPLVDITQRGSSGMKSLAARVLVRLNVLDEQSSFFG